MSRGGCSRTE
eukprot:gene11636-biopygen16055